MKVYDGAAVNPIPPECQMVSMTTSKASDENERIGNLERDLVLANRHHSPRVYKRNYIVTGTAGPDGELLQRDWSQESTVQSCPSRCPNT